ncbi:MAG TPA: CopG family transcriptional regulator [Acidimicrobiales bacterium]|nr:CopG family transcriptional regulator [Acidimicrobiales bacterium]
MRRTQIYVDERQDDRIRARAEALGVTKSEVIRLAVDRYLDAEDDVRRLATFRRAVRASAGAAEIDVDAIEAMRGADRDRLDELHPEA